MKLPKGFIPTSKQLPRLGRNIVILDRHGQSFRAMRTESCFYPCGYCYEDIHTKDHIAEDIVAWKP